MTETTVCKLNLFRILHFSFNTLYKMYKIDTMYYKSFYYCIFKILLSHY